jgi:hypothetical protein
MDGLMKMERRYILDLNLLMNLLMELPLERKIKNSFISQRNLGLLLKNLMKQNNLEIMNSEQ